jgi:tRNA-specific 2-thiouridylase
VVNFVDFYQKEVVNPMVQGYECGITPNPDILCNRAMKFGALLDYAEKNGFSSLATGHYCIRKKTSESPAELWEGVDKNKDQSYFLAKITSGQLEKALFPLGGIEKPMVREIAKKMNLPVAGKKDSQGICFLGKVKITEFLSNFVDDQPGEIVTVDGNVVGQHKGLHRYTLGQRRGIGVPSNTDNENYVVTGKNEDLNQLIIAFENNNESTLWGHKYFIESISFIAPAPKSEVRLLGKARYRDPSVQLTYKPIDEDMAEITFDNPQRALTPGQVLALYDGQRLIGGGTYSHSYLGRADRSFAPNDSA